MVKEIKYTGFTASPSDYECPDGDLAAVLNVVPEEGSLSPILPPHQLFQLTDGGNVRFVHETSYIKNFIILHPDNSITWRTEEDRDQYSHGTLAHNFSGRIIHQINAIGNTLIVLADDGMHYFLWKGYRNGSEQQGDEPKEYLYLGTHMPELSLSFKLRGTLVWSNVFDFDAKRHEDEGAEFPEFFPDEMDGSSGYDRDQTDDDDQILAKVNKFIKWNSDRKGRFLFPFFVRYAYRLYDDTSLTMHSAPILMLCGYPESGIQCLVEEKTMEPSIVPVLENAKLRLIGLFHDLYYKVSSNAEVKDKLNNWKDIIKSVDVFITKPIYTYDQNGNVGGNTDAVFDYSLFKKSSDINISSICDFAFDGKACKKHKLFDVYRDRWELPTASPIPEESIIIPTRDSEDIKLDIEDSNLFYLLRSIPIDKLSFSFEKIPVKKNYLETLATREVLKDDYDSHDTLVSGYCYSYNGRLNIANLRKRLFSGYSASSLFCFTGNQPISDIILPPIFEGETTITPESKPTSKVSVYYYIRQDNKNVVVRGEESQYLSDTPFLYLYYPNSNAYKAVLRLEEETGNISYFSVLLDKHPTLNGSFYFNSLEKAINDISNLVFETPLLSNEENSIIEIRNKIYTSEVNNPYFFPVLGVNTVGAGTIYAMCSAAKALSQGQFGQFPLYAFSSEGVWALEVEMRQDENGIYNIGLYKFTQPFTRDVCINPDSITQLDSSVLFATDRGIMLLSGSNSICISDNLDYSQPFQITSLPQSDKLLAFVGFTQSDLDIVPFRDFVKGCRMLYSYNLQRIIVFNRDYPYAYVYSLKSKSWSMMPSTIAHAIPSYPEALAQLADGTIVDYSLEADPNPDNDALTGVKGVLITRPLKLDAPDVLKTVDTVIQRGNFQRGHIKTAIYGSRDLIHWFVVWTSVDHYLRGFRGTPYKYFRLVLLCDLDPHESIYGCTIQYTPRFTNRLR